VVDVLDCVLSLMGEAAGVRLYDDVVVGADECVRYSGREGMAILPWDAECRDEHGGKVCGLKVV
jgi:hypothetical protein